MCEMAYSRWTSITSAVQGLSTYAEPLLRVHSGSRQQRLCLRQGEREPAGELATFRGLLRGSANASPLLTRARIGLNRRST